MEAAGRQRSCAVAFSAVTSNRVLPFLLGVFVFVVYAYQFTGSTAYNYYPGVVDRPTVAFSGENLECGASDAPRRGGTVLSGVKGFSEPYNLDQRLGQPILAVPFYVVFGDLGFRIAFAFWRVVLFMSVLFLALLWVELRIPAYVASLGLIFNPFLLGITVLNANIQASALVVLSLLVVMRSRGRPLLAVVAGLFGGMLLGVAHVFMAVPAIVALLASQLLTVFGRKTRSMAAVLFVTGVMIPGVLFGSLYKRLPSLQGLPVHLCFNNRLVLDANPEVYRLSSATEDGGDTTPAQEGEGDDCHLDWGGWHFHELGPFTVSIWGMLNWPFHDHIVRSGGVPFPFGLYMVFLSLHTFGALFFALFLLGMALSLRSGRKNAGVAWGLSLYFILEGGFLSVQENIAGHKFSFMVWLFAPIALFAALGLAWLIRNSKRRSWFSYLAILGSLYLLVGWGSGLSFPLDDRWIYQFGWKAISQRTGALESYTARFRQEAVTSFGLMPSGEALSGQRELAPLQIRKDAALESELEGKVSPSNARSWLVAQAVEGTPEGVLVAVNPYLETAPSTLQDPRRCVVSAPALRPEYAGVFQAFESSVKGFAGRDADHFYLIDSLLFPSVDFLRQYRPRRVSYNGYAITYEMSALPDGEAGTRGER